MPITFSCNSCGVQIKAPDNTGGKKVKCPKCQLALVIPNAPAPMPADEKMEVRIEPHLADSSPATGGSPDPGSRFRWKSRKFWLITGGGSLVAVLLIGVTLWAWINGQKTAPFTDELHYMPKKSRFIVTIDLHRANEQARRRVPQERGIQATQENVRERERRHRF